MKLKASAPTILIGVFIVIALTAIFVAGANAMQIRSRDLDRISDLSLMAAGLEAFKLDFGVLPNYTFRLGIVDNEGQSVIEDENSHFGLSARLSKCDSLGYDHFIVDEAGQRKQIADPVEYRDSWLEEGFQPVNEFLACLGYVDKIFSDQRFKQTELDYQYRVSHDYQEMILLAAAEYPSISQTYYLDESAGRSIVVSSVADRDSVERLNLIKPFSTKQRYGHYLYQCLANINGPIPRDNRANVVIPLTNQGFKPTDDCREAVAVKSNRFQ